MNPIAVRALGYRSFDEVSLELPAGCLALTGANGAGKSSLVSIILLALFAERGELAKEIGEFDDRLEIECRFEHQGAEYRARRSCTRKGKTTFDLERWASGEEIGADPAELEAWFPLTRETIAATDELLQEILGLHRETFEASAFLGQGRGALFTEAQPRDRKRILAEVLNLSLWDRLLERAKADRNRIESECATISARTAAAAEEILRRPILEGSKAELDEKAEELARRISGLEEARKEAADKLASAREAAAELKGAREVLATREAELERVEKRVGEIRAMEDSSGDLVNEQAKASRLVARLPDLEAALAAAVAAKAWHDEFVRLNVAADEQAERARAGIRKADALQRAEIETCERCGQALDAEARERAIESYRAEIAEADRKAAELRDAANAVPGKPATATRLIDEIENDLRVSRNAEKVVVQIAADIKRLDELKVERELHERSLPELRTAFEEQRAKVSALMGTHPQVGVLEADLQRVELQLNGARDELAEAGRALAGVERDLERITELEQRVAGEKERLDELQAELDVVLLAEKAYGRDGIPALILESAAIPQIELEANRILSELGTSFTVELRTQRELKGGGLAEALDIVVCSEGAERPLETFSGGERSRIVVALRIALARLLAHRRGAEVRMLVLDEVEYLDEPGMAALVSVLQGLVADFERVIVVSHVPALRDAFDNVIEVVKGEDGRSRIEGALQLQEVTA